MTCVRVVMFTKHCLGCRGNLCVHAFVNTDEALNKMHTVSQPQTGAITKQNIYKKIFIASHLISIETIRRLIP